MDAVAAPRHLRLRKPLLQISEFVSESPESALFHVILWLAAASVAAAAAAYATAADSRTLYYCCGCCCIELGGRSAHPSHLFFSVLCLMLFLSVDGVAVGAVCGIALAFLTVAAAGFTRASSRGIS